MQTALLCESSSSLATALSWTQLSHPRNLAFASRQPSLPRELTSFALKMLDTNCETSSQPNPLCSDAFRSEGDKRFSIDQSQANRNTSPFTNQPAGDNFHQLSERARGTDKGRETILPRELPRILHQQTRPARDRIFADKRVPSIIVR